MAVLDQLVAGAHERAAALHDDGEAVRCQRASFAAALAGRDRIKVIAEFKRRSPSLGGIAPESDVEQQVRAYAGGGAAAVSVLTEPTRFGGCDDDLVRATVVDLPLLMKDFVVAPAQVRLAARLGASAVLLILRCLEDAKLSELVAACRVHGLTPLLECHDEAEVERALQCEGAVIGVNNRDLDTLVVDRAVAVRLLPRIPDDRIAVAESGYADPEQVAPLVGMCNAVLVGTGLMRSANPAAFIDVVGRGRR